MGSIHQLFQVAFRLKQHELELAKKGQDDAVSNDSGGSDGSSKQENGQPAMRVRSIHFAPVNTSEVVFTLPPLSTL